MTYVGADYSQMWGSLFGMFELFNILAIKVSKHYHFAYDLAEYEKVLKFIESKKT
jgi:hypothetical protein